MTLADYLWLALYIGGGIVGALLLLIIGLFLWARDVHQWCASPKVNDYATS